MRHTRQTIKKPNGILYFVFYLLLYPFLKLFFRLQVDRGEYRPPKGPFILLCNHISFMDFVLVMLAAYPRRLNPIAAQKFFFYWPLNWLLPFMGCIPKNLFAPDIRAVKGTMSVLRRGGQVLIFPEGRCAPDGVYAGANQSTGKLIKKLEVPVMSCRIEGAYNCMPFWRDAFRFGRLRVTLANLFDAEDTRRLSVEELNARIDARLGGADAKIPEQPLSLFRARRLVEGLEHLLYYCPACQREFTLKTKGNIISCALCGNAAEMDRFGTLSPLAAGRAPETVHKWFKEQVLYEMRGIHETMEPVEVKVRLRMPATAGKGLLLCGRGTITLDPTGWRYHGELKGEIVHLFFPIESVLAIPFDPNDNFQIYANGDFYVFTPEDNPSACSKYALLGEAVYWRLSPLIQMTPGYDSGFQREDACEKICQG